ncbi:hypothetical protein [Caulobacter flavus]|uniref:hypothetical protein n=1 Tax=Caulobacter flavus TaxID=1679497 RepID=UPI0013DD91F1|nr:hypothetical protein [Caulobacter flavus]
MPVAEKLEGEVEGAPVEEQIRDIAGETLDQLTRTASRAEAKLADARPDAATAFASTNSLTSSAGQNLAEIFDQGHQGLSELAREPAIARLVVADEAGTSKTIFITRATPLPREPGEPFSASYLSPMGRLAALPVGRDADVPTPRACEASRWSNARS